MLNFPCTAEFWLRAFCKDLENQEGNNNYNPIEQLSASYLKLKRKLLGKKP